LTSGQDSELELLGDGPEAPRIQDAIMALGLQQRVRMCGQVPEEVALLVGLLAQSERAVFSTQCCCGACDVVSARLSRAHGSVARVS
jgi:hypothetical protein